MNKREIMVCVTATAILTGCGKSQAQYAYENQLRCLANMERLTAAAKASGKSGLAQERTALLPPLLQDTVFFGRAVGKSRSEVEADAKDAYGSWRIIRPNEADIQRIEDECESVIDR